MPPSSQSKKAISNTSTRSATSCRENIAWPARASCAMAPGGKVLKENKMPEAKLVGGSQADRERILKLHEDYIDANARFDWVKLEPIWSGAPEALFFNLNGHTYRGR